MVFQSCPISGDTRNERVVRIVAAFVVAVSAVSATQPRLIAVAVLLALAADFAVRGFGRPRYSPLATLGRGVANLARLSPKPVDAAPKRFAARIGLAFAFSAATLHLVYLPVAALSVTGVLVACATLEAALGLCVGCRVYSLLPPRLALALAR
ncbi:MAG TPA: DUF4395 domain-containing protein [Coriobacteriia bacterium]